MEATTTQKKMTLFDLREQEHELLAKIARIEERLAANGGVITDEMDEMLETAYAELDETYDSLGDKYSGYLYVMDEIRADADALDARADRLQERVDAFRTRAERQRKNADRLEQRLLDDMIMNEMEEVDCGDAGLLTVRDKPGRATVTIKEDAEDLPARFRREEVKFKAIASEWAEDVYKKLLALAEELGADRKIKPDLRSIKNALSDEDPEATQIAEWEPRPKVLSRK